MNTLPLSKKLLILQSLVEGNSIRSIERITNTHRDTIMRLLVTAGNRAQEIMDEKFVNLKSNFVQVDEVWTYCYKKRGTQTKDEKNNPEIGDQWVFIAIDSETKLVPAFYVGKRNFESTLILTSQLRERITNRFQLSTDSFATYPAAVNQSFGDDVDFAQIHKIYVNDRQYERRYSPPRIAWIRKKWVTGNPDEDKISTSHVERLNLTMRMQLRRFTRLTNAFSKKLANLKAACSLHFFYYNFMRVHKSLKTTPAMESNVANHVWSWEEFLGISMRQKKVA